MTLPPKISILQAPSLSSNYSVAGYLPHDTSLFTEGFLVHNGRLVESTGSPDDLPDAESLVGIIDPLTGKMDTKIRLDKEKYFGEGIVFLKDKLYQLKVTMNGMPRDSLNELEYIKGYIYANVWYTDDILKIEPATGKVVGRINLSSIVADAHNKNPNANVLNGIAYDAASDKIYVVGKRWPNIYQIEFTH